MSTLENLTMWERDKAVELDQRAIDNQRASRPVAAGARRLHRRFPSSRSGEKL